jgi:hypothetical protein
MKDDVLNSVGDALFVGMIVDRQHADASCRSVLRAVHDGFHPRVQNDPDHRHFRRACYRLAIRLHDENRDLYRAVQSGQIGD